MPDAIPAADETTSLRAALDEAQRRGNALAGELNARQQENQQLRGRVLSEADNRLAAQESDIENRLVTAQRNADTAQSEWSRLQAEGDFDGAAKQMRAMTEATTDISQLRMAKNTIAQQRVELKNQPAGDEPNFHPSVKAWIAEHPEFNTSPDFKRRTIQAHHAALAAGHAEHSDSYFEHVNKSMFPDRYGAAAPAGGSDGRQARPAEATGGPAGDGATADSPFSGADGADGQGGDADQGFVIDDTYRNDRHTRNADPVSSSVASEPMRSVQPENPQARAAGNGSGLNSVAAPPSRRVAEAARRVTGGGPVRLTSEEMDYARSLADSIEPDLAHRGDAEVAKWYATLRDSPMADRRRTKWYGRSAP